MTDTATAVETDLRFPTGKFTPPDSVTKQDIQNAIAALEALPRELACVISGLDEVQLNTPYRPDGWTLRQVVRHVPDSHASGYLRFRLALTEDTPEVKGYSQAGFADLADSKHGPVEPSLQLLEGLHGRWVGLLRSLDDAQFARTVKLPGRGELRLDTLLSLYAWHGRHHVAHIRGLRERENW